MIKRNSLVVILIFVCCLPAVTQSFDNRQAGARSVALAHAAVSLQGPESLFHNQAGITGVDHFTVQLFFENEFMVKEFPLQSFSVVLPTSLGYFGGSLLQFGQGSYNERKWGVAYARKWGNRISGSLQFNLLSYHFPENAHSFTNVSAEAGLQWGEPGRMTAGIHLFNPMKTKFNIPGGTTSLPWSLSAGISWYPDPFLMLCTELEVREKTPCTFKTGIEFQPGDLITMRVGMAGKPLALTAGAGLRIENIILDMAFHHHANLGITPAAGIKFEF